MREVVIVVNSYDGRWPLVGIPMYTKPLGLREANNNSLDIIGEFVDICRKYHPVEAGIYPAGKGRDCLVTRVIFRESEPDSRDLNGWFAYEHNRKLFNDQRERLAGAIRSATSVGQGSRGEFIFNIGQSTRR